VQSTPAILTEARDHFADHCAICHGYDGKGSGLGKHMYPPAPDMTEAATQNLSDGQIFYIISNGVRFTGMPAWRDEDSSDAIWKLVVLIRYLPHLTPADIQQMKSAHPEAAGDHEHQHHQ
jgi:mono/diheme cytochrome c family protein